MAKRFLSDEETVVPRLNIITCLFVLVSYTQAGPPHNYYEFATNKKGDALRSALHNVIDDHKVFPYSSKNINWEARNRSNLWHLMTRIWNRCGLG